jgi:hypothetical protein
MLGADAGLNPDETQQQYCVRTGKQCMVNVFHLLLQRK